MNTSERDELKADVAIIGGGGCGLAAAVTAAELGASVIVVEKRRVVGGNSRFAEGFFAAGSTVQKRLKIDARRDALFKKALDYSHYTIDPRVIRAFIDKSAETADWLEDKGLSFQVPMLYPNQVPATWHVPRHGGAQIVRTLSRSCSELGVRVQSSYAAKKILTNEDGTVQGIVVEGKGEALDIAAKAVIVASGGFAGNKDLMKKYFPTFSANVLLLGLPHTGDGFLMATEVGAGTAGLGGALLNGQFVPGDNANKGLGWSLPLIAVAGEPQTLWVNLRAERFIDECVAWNPFEAANAQLRQPNQVTYTIFDERLKTNWEQIGLRRGVGELFLHGGSKLPRLGDRLRARVEDGTVVIADSVEQLAAGIGVSPEALVNTFEDYNRCCDLGHDAVFAKDPEFLEPLRTPPYYAVRTFPSIATTFGGIKVDASMRVLGVDDQPIPGLYAGGDAVGGWESETYCGVLSGSALGFALNSGRIAAETASDFSLGAER